MNKYPDNKLMGKISQEGTHERRDFNRIPVGGIAMLRPMGQKDGHKDAVLMGKIVDVSASGLSVLLDRSIEPQQDLELLISVDDPETQFLIWGTVMWCRDNIGGITENRDYSHRAGIILAIEQDQEDAIDWRALFLA